MKCRNCGHDNPEYSEVCENCAVSLRSEPQRDDDTPSWGFVDENKDIRFSFGGRNAAQNNNPADMNQNTDSDLDELERQFTCDVGDWNEVQRRPNAGRQKNNRQNAAAAQRNDRTSSLNGAERANRSSAQNTQGAFAGRARGNKRAKKQRGKGRDSTDIQDDFDTARTSADYGAKRGRRDDSYDEFEDVNRRSDRRRGKGGASGLRIAIIVLAVVAVIAAGVLAYTLLNGSSIGGEKTNSVIVNPNNPDSYYITVYAKAGSVLVYEDSTGAQTEQQVPEKGYVTFNVASNRLRPITPIEGESCDIYPSVSLKNEDGTLTKLEIPRITLRVPTLNASFETAEDITSDNGVIEIKGHVDLTQTDLQNNPPVVTINNETVQPDGSFAYTTKLDKGEYEIVGEIKLGGYMIMRRTFKATVSKQLTASDIISIPEEVDTRVLNVETSIELTGTVPAGAVLQVVPKDAECTVKDQPTVDENGNFRFSVNLPTAAKCYELQLTATLADGTVYTRPFFVERPPVFNEYVPTVWRGDYSEMSKPVHITDLRGFVIEGTVAEITYDDDYLVATFTLNDGHTISIEYHDHYSAARQHPIEAGKQYKLYGFSKGVDESGMLRMYIWFVSD